MIRAALAPAPAPALALLNRPIRLFPIRVLAERDRPVPVLPASQADLLKMVEAEYESGRCCVDCYHCASVGGRDEPRGRTCAVIEGDEPLTECPATDDADGVHESARWQRIEADVCEVAA